ncbi:hypothetical protein WJX73_008392 [Symbiochloris irregularis]|uniref:Uncharacterized protein n=1 Tax=Symbiochloris irregularis TaxID=706552 RepID=A0AAW1P7H1_9CHLO
MQMLCLTKTNSVNSVFAATGASRALRSVQKETLRQMRRYVIRYHKGRLKTALRETDSFCRALRLCKSLQELTFQHKKAVGAPSLEELDFNFEGTPPE